MLPFAPRLRPLTLLATCVLCLGLGGVAAAASNKYVSVSGPTTHACAITAGGTVYCWGGSKFLGDKTGHESLAPVKVEGVKAARAIAVGNNFSCALLASERVNCWGRNNKGQLGNKSRQDSIRPTAVIDVAGAKQLSLGPAYACALLGDQTIKCWGELVNDGVSNGHDPQTVVGVVGAQQISVGSNHACALLGDQTVKCWGANSHGQLGNGNYNWSWPLAGDQAEIANVIQISAGQAHSCALVSDGSVSCWGRNDQGQLGNGTTTSSATPVKVLGLADIKQIDSGRGRSCAISLKRSVKCWGLNASGQPGDGIGTAPLTVDGVDDAVALAHGSSSSCALVNNQTIKCWGANSHGQLGNGLRGETSVPTSLISGSVSAGLIISRNSGWVTESGGISNKIICLARAQDSCRGQLSLVDSRQRPLLKVAYSAAPGRVATIVSRLSHETMERLEKNGKINATLVLREQSNSLTIRRQLVLHQIKID